LSGGRENELCVERHDLVGALEKLHPAGLTTPSAWVR
jgi:hypothetical protein